MRKVILTMSVSLDGFIEGPDREIDWHMVDDELLGAALELADQIVENTPFGTWMGKATLWSNLEVPSLEAAIDLEARTQILALATEDAAEQRRAVGAKRPPDYKLR